MIDMELDPKQYSRQLMRYCENDYYTKLYIDIKRKGVLNEFNKTYKEQSK